MASLTPYKGLEVVENAGEDGGIALTDNFKELADRAPYELNRDPGANDDSSDGFQAGDQWLNTSTQTMWVCVDASVGSAVWKSFFVRTSTELALIPEESSESVSVGGDLTVEGTGDSSFNGKVGIGVSSPNAKLHGTGSTIVGADSAAVADGDLGNGQVNIWVDETNDKLVFKVKYSNGTVKSASLDLA